LVFIVEIVHTTFPLNSTIENDSLSYLYRCQLKLKIVSIVSIVYCSLCTTLCLQWEPEIIAVSLIYLACKLSKFELNDWQGRTSNHLRWWDMFVQGMNMDLLEG